MKRLKVETENKLEKKVLSMINSYSKDYDDGIESFINDLSKGGCQSGMISELTYYSDTVKFYNKYKDEISALLSGLIQESGSAIDELFGDRWDKDDPLALGSSNLNLLAWFAFEEIAFNLCRKAGIEI